MDEGLWVRRRRSEGKAFPDMNTVAEIVVVVSVAVLLSHQPALYVCPVEGESVNSCRRLAFTAL